MIGLLEKVRWVRVQGGVGSSSRRRDLLRDERGLSTVEYVIILVLIAAASIGLWVTLGGELKEKITEATEEFDQVQVDGGDDK